MRSLHGIVHSGEYEELVLQFFRLPEENGKIRVETPANFREDYSVISSEGLDKLFANEAPDSRERMRALLNR